MARRPRRMRRAEAQRSEAQAWFTSKPCLWPHLSNKNRCLSQSEREDARRAEV